MGPIPNTCVRTNGDRIGVYDDGDFEYGERGWGDCWGWDCWGRGDGCGCNLACPVAVCNEFCVNNEYCEMKRFVGRDRKRGKRVVEKEVVMCSMR